MKQAYRYWRIRVFYSMYIGYTLFYFTRKSFTFAMPGMIGDLGFDKSELGVLGTVLALSYAVSKFLSGMLSDKSSLRYFMSLGLILTGVFNLFFGLSSSIVLFSVCLCFNGLFQGWGAPPCAKLLTYWYSKTERGRWWGFWNTSHNIGGALIPVLCAIAIQMFGWRYAMYLPGVMAILGGLFIMNRLRDKPKELGLPSIEKFHNDYDDENDKGDEEKDLSLKEILVEHILKNKFMWVLAFSFFFVYIIREAVFTWVQIYLMESKGYALLAAGSCVSWFEIGGIFGSLVAGWMSDTLFKGKRVPVNIIFCVGIIFSLIALWMAPSASLFLVSSIIFLIGFLIFGPQMLIGMAAAEIAHKEAAGTATGFVGFFAYLGAATAGYPVAKVTEGFGWLGFFIFVGACAVISILLLFPLWSKRTQPQLEQPG